ncbi:MAG TPA: universal stress protein, partial [Propionibacteriaceae bacterium]|nr:universal stress protein [Propionibacteriaceae bacterium]
MALRIVIGYDGSDAGEDAVAFGLTWCRSTGDVPVVATVYPEEHPLGAGRVDAEWAAYVRELGQETLDKAQAAAGDAAIYRLVASTSAARGLADLAEDVDAAAVLVGGGRKDEAGGGRLGSVANRLLYGATVPVCVVPEAWQASDGGVISKIGVAFIDTKDGHEALR